MEFLYSHYHEMIHTWQQASLHAAISLLLQINNIIHIEGIGWIWCKMRHSKHVRHIPYKVNQNRPISTDAPHKTRTTSVRSANEEIYFCKAKALAIGSCLATIKTAISNASKIAAQVIRFNCFLSNVEKF